MLIVAIPRALAPLFYSSPFSIYLDVRIITHQCPSMIFHAVLASCHFSFDLGEQSFLGLRASNTRRKFIKLA